LKSHGHGSTAGQSVPIAAKWLSHSHSHSALLGSTPHKLLALSAVTVAPDHIAFQFANREYYDATRAPNAAEAKGTARLGAARTIASVSWARFV
jgi:hypothetical protein